LPLRSEAVETLTSAGLTVLQANVYFALVRSGKANIKSISQLTSLDRSNVYKTIETLQQLGLVEKMVGIPNSYIALPIEYGLSMLLKKKTQECAALKKKSNDFLKKFVVVYKKMPEEEYFTILPGKGAFIKKWEETLKTVEYSVDIIVTEKREPEDEPIWEIYRNLLFPKGVKVRWIIDRSRRNDKEFLLRVKEFRELLKYSNLKMKISFEILKPYGITCDDKFAVFVLDSTPCVKHSRTLWTNNRAMVRSFQEHFEAKWASSQEYNPMFQHLVI
jgi:sugar-specific transcriptional regulator TrmB